MSWVIKIFSLPDSKCNLGQYRKQKIKYAQSYQLLVIFCIFPTNLFLCISINYFCFIKGIQKGHTDLESAFSTYEQEFLTLIFFYTAYFMLRIPSHKPPRKNSLYFCQTFKSLYFPPKLYIFAHRSDDLCGRNAKWNSCFITHVHLKTSKTHKKIC